MNHNKLNSLALVLAVSMLCATSSVYAQDETDSSEATPSATSTETSEPSSGSDEAAANTGESEASAEQAPEEETASASESQTETSETDSEETDTEDSSDTSSDASEDSDEQTAASDETEESADAVDSEETVAEEGDGEVSDAEGEETVAEESDSEASDAEDEETVAEESDSEASDTEGEETVAEEGDGEASDAEGEETVAEEGDSEASDAEDEETVAEEGGCEASDTEGEETVAEAGDCEASDTEGEETVAEAGDCEASDAEGEETVAEEGNCEASDEEALETGEPVWASQWAGSFFSVEGSSNSGVDSICGLYQNSNVENWAEAQWITVHGWVQLTSDDEAYTGPLQAKLLAGWYVSHPDAATCPTEAPCTGGENAVADEEASQVVVSDENGYVEFSVTGWWPGVDESFIEAADSESENELEQFAQYYVETHFGAKIYGESGEALGRFDRADQASAEMSKDVFWYPAELTESCAYTPPPPPTCLIFAVHDHGLNDSYIFTLDPNDDFAVNELSFHENYDIEGLAIDPQANKLLASSGNDAQQGHPNGHLYQVDKETGDVTSIGNICYTDEEEQSHCDMEVSSLSFHPDGTLWGWAEGDGLLFIDPDTAEAKLVTASDAGIEDLAWNNSGKVVYAIAEDTLWAYDGYSLTAQCPMDSPAESIERLPDNVRAAYGLPEDHDVFMFAYHKESDLTMHALDAQTCEVLDAFRIPTTKYYDIEGISWVCNAGLDNPPPVFSSEESVTTEDGDIIDSLKPISGDVINVVNGEWDDTYNKQATAWVGGDSDDALAIRFKNIELPEAYYIDTAYLVITNNLAAESSMVDIKAQAEKSSTSESFDEDNLPTDRTLTDSFHRYEQFTTWEVGDQLIIEITGPLRELANENILSDTIALVLTGQGSSEDRKYFNIEDVQLVLNLRLISNQDKEATVVVPSPDDDSAAEETPAEEEETVEDTNTEDAETDNSDEDTETDVTEDDANSDEETGDSETTDTEEDSSGSETDDSEATDTEEDASDESETNTSEEDDSEATDTEEGASNESETDTSESDDSEATDTEEGASDESETDTSESDDSNSSESEETLY